jgi:alcohol dehydrogenase class IV
MNFDFSWQDGERLIRFGTGSLADVEELLAARGFAGYALLTSPTAKQMAPRLAEEAGSTIHVPVGSVTDAATAIREQIGERPLVALGGGRVIDSAKAVAAADGLPCAAVPTTLSGAELTRIHRLPAGVSTDTRVRPSFVLIDPTLSASQPAPLLTASAMNALAHGVEALYVPAANPVAELAALKGSELIAQALSDTRIDADQIALGALLCAYALDASGYAVHHMICQGLVMVAGVSHAQTNAVMLPHSVAFMADRAPEAISKVAAALGASDSNPGVAPDYVRRLSSKTGYESLSELGVDETSVEPVAELALGRPPMANTPPSPPTFDELCQLVRSAL